MSGGVAVVVSLSPLMRRFHGLAEANKGMGPFEVESRDAGSVASFSFSSLS